MEPIARRARGLTPKQRFFALEYLIDGNGTQAAIRAGYAPKAAGSQATWLLKNPHVAAFIEAQLGKRQKKLELTAERLDEELARVAYFDPREAYDEEGRLRPVREMPDDIRRCIAGFEEEALFDTVVVGEGPRGGEKKERVQVGVVRKVKWQPKVEAIIAGHRRLGLYADKLQLEHTLTYEQLALLAKKLREDRQAQVKGKTARKESQR